MIKLSDKQKQLKLTDDELAMALNSLGVKPNADGEIELHDAKRLSDWYEGYTEANAIFEGANK